MDSKNKPKPYSQFNSKKFVKHELHPETEKELAKKTLESLVFSGGVLAVALTIVTNTPKLANQKYNIDGNKVVYSYGLTHNKIIEYTEKGKIKYIQHSFPEKTMKRVNVNGTNYNPKNTLIYKQYEERYNYLSNKIKEIEKQKYTEGKKKKTRRNTKY